MGSFTTLRPLLSARAPMLASVRTHLGYIPFEGRTAAPPNQMVKFTLELKKANMQPVTKVHKLKIGFRIIIQSFTGHLHLWPNDWKLPQFAEFHVLLEHEESAKDQPENGDQGDCGGRSQWAHHSHEFERRPGSWGLEERLCVYYVSTGIAQIRCGNLTELEIATVVNHYLLPLVKVVMMRKRQTLETLFASGGGEGHTDQIWERCWTGGQGRQRREREEMKQCCC